MVFSKFLSSSTLLFSSFLFSSFLSLFYSFSSVFSTKFVFFINSLSSNNYLQVGLKSGYTFKHNYVNF